MANSFLKATQVSSILLALFLSFVTSSVSTRIVPIGTICSKHTNPSYCNYVLKAATPGSDLIALSQYTINVAHVYAFDTLNYLIHGLAANAPNPQLKQHYQTCSMDYNDVLLDLTQAKQSCSSGDYNGMKSNAGAVMKDVQHCGSMPPMDPSKLPKNNYILKDMSLIIMILADFLTGKY